MAGRPPRGGRTQFGLHAQGVEERALPHGVARDTLARRPGPALILCKGAMPVELHGQNEGRGCARRAGRLQELSRVREAATHTSEPARHRQREKARFAKLRDAGMREPCFRIMRSRLGRNGWGNGEGGTSGNTVA